MSKFAVFIFVAMISTAFALRCYVGGGTTGSRDHPEVYQQPTCADRNEQFCYKREFFNNGMHTVIKNCGNGFCRSEGCDVSTGVCCCRGDFCNGAEMTSSLIMTSLVAAVAAFFKY